MAGAIRQKRIDLLVADVVLQGRNGLAVVRRIRPSQALMLLLIGGFSLTELQLRGLLSASDIAKGSAEFLQERFSSEALLHRVAKLLLN